MGKMVDYYYEKERLKNLVDKILSTKYGWLPQKEHDDFYSIAGTTVWYCEKHYDDIPRKIVCEPLIATSAPTEYQCWCVNGEPDSLLVCRKNFDGTYDAFSYSCDFRQLFERKGEKPNEEVIARPACLEQILDYARILSADFPFVRADFYEVEGKVYFAELTFTPNCNYLLNYNEPFHQRLGSKLKLPKR